MASITLLMCRLRVVPVTGRSQTLKPAYAQTQRGRTKGADPIAQPAISAILAAFDKYEVVAMAQGHGMQNLNDFIHSLIRIPALSEKVNDIEVEAGNLLYLD